MTTIRPTAISLHDVYLEIRADLERVGAIFEQELHSERAEVAALCRHLGRFRGKMLRPALVLLAARATGTVSPVHLNLAAVLEMFHLATLVHDDVLDGAAERRRAATINAGWGNEAAVMLGDWLVSHAYHLCTRQSSRWASLQISAMAHRVCEGELVQLFSRGDLAMDVPRYLSIVEAKTASLTALAAQFGAHFNDASPDVESACADYGLDLGVAFQIVDDVLDLVGDQAEAGKTLGSDLAKGEATLPLIQFLAGATAAQRRRIESLMAGPSSEAAAEVRAMLIGSGCVSAAEAVAAERVARAKAHLDRLPDTPARVSLQLLADFVLVRNR